MKHKYSVIKSVNQMQNIKRSKFIRFYEFFFLTYIATLCMITEMHGQLVGQSLPSWTPGTLDIHEISTGRGSSSFLVLPDGTTIIYDAGEFTETNQKWRIPRYVDAKPDSTENSGVWISKYVNRFIGQTPSKHIDYALLSHFHWDHMGQITSRSPLSNSGTYKLSGITTVAEQVKIAKIIDRDWPLYNFPKEQNSATMENYKLFLKWQIDNNDLMAEKFMPGRNNQIILKYEPDDYPNFEIRNLASNGKVWTGIGDNVRQYYPQLTSLEEKEYPTENMCSIALRLSYGKFDYYTGGDLRGISPPGTPNWHDLETPIAQVTGPVEVAQMNHHGYIDSQNSFFVSTLRPQVWTLSVWDSAHPSPTVYKRMLSERLYPGPRDIFTTNMHEANKLVVVGLDKLKSDNGHIVIRVTEKGDSFKVIILDDRIENGKIKAVHGPYFSR